MNAELKEAFSQIKPACDLVMVYPNPESVAAFESRLAEAKTEAVQALQQYITFPLITHLKSTEIEKNINMQVRITDALRTALERITVDSFEMCLKMETGLLSLVFDKSQPGMIADVPEELKLSVLRCLTTLALRLAPPHRAALLRTQAPLLAQNVFVSVHVAKLERLRALRLAALDCLTAHTATHRQFTDAAGHITDPALAALAADALCGVLPGVLAALQDVATCARRPGHAVVVAALDAIHRILCTVMSDAHLPQRPAVTAEDFARVLGDKCRVKHKDVSDREKDPKSMRNRSPEWYAMAGDKLRVVTESLAALRTHEHYKVRRELAVFCYRLLSECHTTMQPSIPLALDVLISLRQDGYPAVAQYCERAVAAHFSVAGAAALDSVCGNLMATMSSLPRMLNNIDSDRKLSALNLLHGYLQILCDDSRPQRLTCALSARSNMQCCCNALVEAASVEHLTSMAQYAARDVTAAPPADCPWLRLRHLDAGGAGRLRAACALLGAAECAELVLDRLLEMFRAERSCEVACVINWMGSAPNASHSLVKRILDTYIEEDVWYLPLEVRSVEVPVSQEESLDVTVYDPRAWVKDSVPGLYEGSTETRYSGISYLAPRRAAPPAPHACRSLAEAQRNLLLSCLLTEGVGIAARRLMEEYQPYLLKTLCLVLERVGSKYEMLHLAGLKAINAVALAGAHASVADLIRCNADYFTHQVTLRLKKAWNSKSALQILSVVMEYSDPNMLDCLYGIVEDVLVQSCDKYHARDLQSYLQVFLTFIECIAKWFSVDVLERPDRTASPEIDVLKDVQEYAEKVEEGERLLSNEEFERETGKSAEEMYREDLQKKEEDVLDYDDTVTDEKQPLPQHVAVTITILRRCIHFVTANSREEAVLALQVLARGLPILKLYEDQLLPLVHQAWAPLVARFERNEATVMRPALGLLTTMAALAKDFIRSRAVKEVLPQLYRFLRKASLESHLKDAGSVYRTTAAYSLQLSALAALPSLAEDLVLDDDMLDAALHCADAYLSNKQPKPLQALAVKFFKAMLQYDYGATWLYLRRLCDNRVELPPPPARVALRPVVGTPYEPAERDYENNIKLIFTSDDGGN